MESGVTCERGVPISVIKGPDGVNSDHGGGGREGLLILHIILAWSRFGPQAVSRLIVSEETPPSPRSITGRNPAGARPSSQCHYFQSSAISGALRGCRMRIATLGGTQFIAHYRGAPGESAAGRRGLREQFSPLSDKLLRGLGGNVLGLLGPPMLQIPIVREGVFNQWGIVGRALLQRALEPA